MASAFGFPDWVPWWVQLLVLIGGILIALAFMLMPFSVFGLKSRLDVIDARLDEIQGEIRVLALRLQEAPRRPVYEENPVPVAPSAYPTPAQSSPTQSPPAQSLPTQSTRPPPASWTPDGVARRPIGAVPQTLRQEPALSRPRAEPRLDRFR
jgi:disintegrin/metalloproteinase domain-containing protein 1